MENNKRKSGWLLAAVVILFAIVLAACQTTTPEPTSTVLPTIAFNQRLERSHSSRRAGDAGCHPHPLRADRRDDHLYWLTVP